MAHALEHHDNVVSNERGCLRCDLLTSDEDADTMFLYEVYADAVALKTHFNTPCKKRYLEDTGPMIARRTRSRCTLAHE